MDFPLIFAFSKAARKVDNASPTGTVYSSDRLFIFIIYSKSTVGQLQNLKFISMPPMS